MKVVLLAMREYEENLGVTSRIQEIPGDDAYIIAVADYPEQAEIYKAAGVDAVWDIDTEAGTGFAEEVIMHLGDDWNLKKD